MGDTIDTVDTMDTIWIGIDDTDSVEGGCTTYIAQLVVEQAMKNGYSLIGFPRLVRLNPNVPWKTRGNGAISIRIGIGKGKGRVVGERDGKKMISFDTSSNGVESDIIFEIIDKIIREHAFLSDRETNPGFVICRERPPEEIYFKGVRSILELDEIESFLDSTEALYRGYKNGRGVIGATAAIAWRPMDRTYELVTYRYRERWGMKRGLDESSIKEMDGRFVSTFDNYDYANKRNRIAPNSPCPILYGIRGDDPKELHMAKNMIRSEEYSGWMLFETNQGTDDHLQRKPIWKIRPSESVIVDGEVVSKPKTIGGGHVIFKIRDGSGDIDCAAYEPTKEFRRVIRRLEVGDFVEVYGGVREKPFTINLEKIWIKKLIRLKKKVENPICPKCGKHMKSIGRGQGYRCVNCRTRKEDARYVEVKRDLETTFYEVPVCARRHLSKPLIRKV